MKTIKYSLSNAPADTPLLRLAQMQGQRYWVERAFEDAKGECGLADYQALGWRSWHHHVTMVMLAMLFIAEQRVGSAAGPGIADAARHRRDAERDPAAQTGRKGRARRPDQRAPRAQTRRHRIPLPHSTRRRW